MRDPIDREILLAFWKVHILHHAESQPVYGQWMLEELRHHGFSLSPGTLYPILTRMTEHGWLQPLRPTGSGPKARREYRLTPKGAEVLGLIRKQVEELHSEVVREARGEDSPSEVAPTPHPRRRP